MSMYAPHESHEKAPPYHEQYSYNPNYGHPMALQPPMMSKPHMSPQPPMTSQQQIGPTSNTNTNVVVNMQPQAGQGGLRRPWRSGMCGCINDLQSCCGVMFCGTCYLCHLASLMGEDCWLPFCVHYTLPALRLKLRTEQKIEGSIFKDCCAVAFCYPCVMCQMRRELRTIENRG